MQALKHTDLQNLLLHIEALIFASDQPIKIQEMIHCLEAYTSESFDRKTISNLIVSLQQKYHDPQFAFSIEQIAGGYTFMTKEPYQPILHTLLKQKSKKRLSKAALETLAIIAYKQPIVKSEIEKIRGVNVDYSIKKLLEKELIHIKGRSQDVGRPLLYATSDKFMHHFGLNSIKDLPKLKEFAVEENQIGEEKDVD